MLQLANNSIWMYVDVDPLRYRPAVKGLCTRGNR